MLDLDESDVLHKDGGFIVLELGNSHCCHFWEKVYSDKLRTIANSELLPHAGLVEYERVLQVHVETVMVTHCAN